MVPFFNCRRTWLYSKLVLTVAAHFVLVLGCMASLFCIVYYEPWYLSIPLGILMGSPLLSGPNCALNHLENRFRGELGLSLVESDFILHYAELLNKKLRK